MDFNFTGSTKRRNINLGNRKLSTQNKSSFLKSVQQERVKREQQRKELRAAEVIQSAIRAKIQLFKIRKQISESWNGSNIKEFNFFFKDLVADQSHQSSINLLDQLVSTLNSDQIKNEPTLTMTSLVNTLIVSVKQLSLQKNVDASLVEKILLIINNLLQPDASTIDKNKVQFDSLIESLIISFNKSEVVYDSILLYSVDHPKATIQFFGTYQPNFLYDSKIKHSIHQLKSLIKSHFAYIVSNKIEFQRFSDLQNFNYLMNILTLLFETFDEYESIINENFIKALAIILGNITCGIVFKDGNADDGDDDDDDNGMELEGSTTLVQKKEICSGSSSIIANTDFQSKVKNLYMGSFPKLILRSCESLNIDADTQVSLFYSLLQFIALKDTRCNDFINSAFKNNIIVTLIVASGSSGFLNLWFGKLCDNHFYNEVLVLVEEKNYKIDEDDELWKSAFSSNNESWWRTFYLVQELYSYLLYVSHDKDLFAPGRLDKGSYISFVSFLKNFSIFIVLGGRSVSSSLTKKMDVPLFKNMLHSFQNNGRLSIKLLQQIYLRDLRMKLFDEKFWLLQTVTFNVNTITPLLEMIENFHVDLDPEEDENGEFNKVDLFSTNGAKLFGKIANQYLIDNILILTYLPFMLAFEKRAELFHQLIALDKAPYKDGGFYISRLRGTISRENILFDSFESFGQATGGQFKGPLSVEFLNKFGEKEAGIDGGGLTKELLTGVVGASFLNTKENQTQNGGLKFFDTTSSYELYPDASYFFKLKYQQKHPESKCFPSEERTFYLQLLKFLGMVIGKCLYENVLIDLSFAPFFLSRWSSQPSKSHLQVKSTFLGSMQRSGDTQQYRNSFDDLKGFDIELYHNLIKLLNLSEEELDALDLSFTISEPITIDNKQEIITLPLVPDGENLRVNQHNKLQYIYSVAKFKLDQRIAIQSNYFLDGLFQIIKPHWLSLFNPYELQTLISGGEKEIDIDDLFKHCVFGGYSNGDQTIKYLREILTNEFTNSQKSKFLKFVTSSSKQPLLGFRELSPAFGIRKSGRDMSRLPTASTCVNLLKLPDYQDKEILKEKLLYSINAEAGFDLS